MSRKKYREIVVNGVPFAWNVRIVDSYYKYKMIRIWKDKKIVADFENKRSYQITPKKIERYIRLFLIKNLPTNQNGNQMLHNKRNW